MEDIILGSMKEAENTEHGVVQHFGQQRAFVASVSQGVHSSKAGGGGISAKLMIEYLEDVLTSAISCSSLICVLQVKRVVTGEIKLNTHEESLLAVTLN